MAKVDPDSRVHDLLAACLGAFAALMLLSTPVNVDTSGPDPFYKGPLIFPLIVLLLMVLASLPAVRRLARPPEGAAWHLDGAGFPKKTLVVLAFLVAYLFGLVVIGLEVSTLAFLVASLYYLGHRSPARLVLVPIIVTGLVVLIFKHLLDVFFPAPLALEWLLE